MSIKEQIEKLPDGEDLLFDDNGLSRFAGFDSDDLKRLLDRSRWVAKYLKEGHIPPVGVLKDFYEAIDS